MMFAIIPNLTRKNAAQVTRLICAKLDELGAAYSLPLSTENVFSDTKAEFLPEKELLGGCEAVITVGGDGTIIHSAKKAAVYSKPVLGINAGRLAFMAGLEIHELDLLEKLITGDYSMDKRMMLKTTAADGDSVQSGYSMNELHRDAPVEAEQNIRDKCRSRRQIFQPLSRRRAHSLDSDGFNGIFSLCRRSRGRSEA